MPVIEWADDDRLTNLAPSTSDITFISSFVSKKCPMWLIANWLSQLFPILVSGQAIIPALFINRSNVLKFSLNESEKFLTELRLPKSISITLSSDTIPLRFWFAILGLFAGIITSAPAATKALVVSSPMPE